MNYHMSNTTDYWRVYFDDSIIKRSDSIREEHVIVSTGVDIHVDVYPHPDLNAPAIVFNHGAAGYCRLFAGLAQLLNDRGYHVVLPDQRGQGLSGGRRGDYTIAECVINIVDVAFWTKERFSSPLFLAGGSLGGALTYYAAAAGAPVDAIACLNLFDFGNGIDGIMISRLAFLARISPIIKAMNIGARLLSPLYSLRIPFHWVGAFNRLMDDRDTAFQAQWDADPVPSRMVTIRSLASSLITKPAIPFEHSNKPVLVINQMKDRMVNPLVTWHNYDRLGSPKQYLEIPFGHWSSSPEFWGIMVDAFDDWFRSHASSSW